MQVHHPLGAGLRPHTARVVIAPSNGYPATTESNIPQVQAQCFTWPEATVKH
jgi:hypothetical protein